MALPNIFNATVSNQVIERIHSLQATTAPMWGKMNVAQMLAHCNVTYEMVFENIHPKPNAFLKFILKAIVKKKVVSDAPFPQNGKTAPAFVIKEAKNFATEKQRLIHYITQAQTLGESHFDHKVSHSFGVLTTTEWSNLFYKHLDHHLTQFGV
jgi:Protein of unknown function (DUF1569)